MSPSYPPEPGIPGEPPSQPDLDGFDLAALAAGGPGSDDAELLERLTDGLAEYDGDLKAQLMGELMMPDAVQWGAGIRPRDWEPPMPPRGEWGDSRLIGGQD